MAAPSPLHVCVVEWGGDGPPSVWVGTHLDYVARFSAVAIYDHLRESAHPSMVGLAVELGSPYGQSFQYVRDWHQALHEATTLPLVTFYYASVDGGEAMAASGWLQGQEPD